MELSAAEAMALEPELRCTRALLSPSTGVVDSHAYMAALLGSAENNGAVLALSTPVLARPAITCRTHWTLTGHSLDTLDTYWTLARPAITCRTSTITKLTTLPGLHSDNYAPFWVKFPPPSTSTRFIF